MQINQSNYYTIASQTDFTSLPEALKKGHDFVAKATENGQTWNAYYSSEALRKTIDIYFSKLSEFLSATEKSKITAKAAGSEKVSPTPADVSPVKESRTARKKTSAPEPVQPTLVERIPEDLRFIKRFVNLNGKTKTKDEILRFLNALQKSILEKRIRKTSPYADQIRLVQDKLLSLYNTMGAKTKIELKPDTYDALKELTATEKVMPSVNFIKRYISMNGKSGMKEKAKQLLTQINRAIDKGKIPYNDPYTVEIADLKQNLKTFITDKSAKALEIEKATLNGLEGILGCACQTVAGLPEVMNSLDFAELEFKTIGLKGKWLDLIGDPSSNFTAMVFGKPKMGKSYLCIDFAGYLARNHGKVLYVAREEGLDYTLQQKLNDKQVADPNLFVASSIPASLSQYDFIFLDSVNKLGLTPEDLTRLKKQNPTKSFIFVFQATKNGNFRGANTFQHDVDVVIEVPEKGKAVQMGRFNQGGETSIFN